MSDTPVLWANKVKYLSVSFYCKSGLSSIISRLWYVKATMSWWSCIWSSHIVSPVSFYGCEVIEAWSLSTSDVHKINALWNNGFRRIFCGFWRESVKLLQFYSNILPATLIVDKRKLLFWKKCFRLRMWFLGQFHVLNVITSSVLVLNME